MALTIGIIKLLIRCDSTNLRLRLVDFLIEKVYKDIVENECK